MGNWGRIGANWLNCTGEEFDLEDIQLYPSDYEYDVEIKNSVIWLRTITVKGRTGTIEIDDELHGKDGKNN